MPDFEGLTRSLAGSPVLEFVEHLTLVGIELPLDRVILDLVAQTNNAGSDDEQGSVDEDPEVEGEDDEEEGSDEDSNTPEGGGDLSGHEKEEVEEIVAQNAEDADDEEGGDDSTEDVERWRPADDDHDTAWDNIPAAYTFSSGGLPGSDIAEDEEDSGSGWVTEEEDEDGSFTGLPWTGDGLEFTDLDLGTVARSCQSLPRLKTLTLAQFMYKPTEAVEGNIVNIETLEVFQVGTWRKDDILDIFDHISARSVHLHTFRRSLGRGGPPIRMHRGLTPHMLDLSDDPR